MIRVHTPALARLALILSMMTLASQASAQTTYTINSLGDQANAQNDANCVSTVGTCTLRTALQASIFASSPITIQIAASIPTSSSGKSIINVNSPLPPILVPTTIAGETHPNYSGGGFTYLVINGNSGVDNASGLVLSGASGSTIRHIAVRGFGEDGIVVANGGNYSITDNVIGGSWVNTDIQIDGNGDNGIRIVNASSSGNSTVIQDNVIMANGGSGIVVQDGSSNTVVQGNVVGLQPPLFFPGAFRPQAGNGGDGILIDNSAGPDNLIGFFAGNTVSNNSGTGIRIRSDEQSVFGNRIGVPHDGEVASGYSSEDYGNGGSGVALLSSGNTVGGSGGQRNVIGQNAFSGISLGSSLLSNPVEATNNSVIGNWVGTDNEGTFLGQNIGIRVINGFDNVIRNNTISFNDTGLSISSGGSFYTRNTIVENVNRGVYFQGGGQLGSSDWADANVIGNQPVGVRVDSYDSDNPTTVVAIRKNYIGTDADGELKGNDTGIIVLGADNRVWIGQADGSGNVIANNNTGIRLGGGASGVLVAGNFIGVHSNGQAMGNGRGIALSELSGASPSNNQIGFSLTDTINPETWTPGEDASNVIAYNFIAIELLNGGDDAVNNSIRGNQIFESLIPESPGIDLGMEEVDFGGAAAGPNNQMNFPELDPDQTQINPTTGEIEYRFRVQTDAANAAYPLLIDFYLADGNTQQGEIFLGSDEYLASQTFEFRSGSLPLPENVPSGGFLVATATDADGNTSQFTIDPVELLMPDTVFQDRFE